MARGAEERRGMVRAAAAMLLASLVAAAQPAAAGEPLANLEKRGVAVPTGLSPEASGRYADFVFATDGRFSLHSYSFTYSLVIAAIDPNNGIVTEGVWSSTDSREGATFYPGACGIFGQTAAGRVVGGTLLLQVPDGQATYTLAKDGTLNGVFVDIESYKHHDKAVRIEF